MFLELQSRGCVARPEKLWRSTGLQVTEEDTTDNLSTELRTWVKDDPTVPSTRSTFMQITKGTGNTERGTSADIDLIKMVWHPQ